MLNKQQLHELVIDGLPVALFMVDSDYRIIEFNKAAEQITGKKRSEVLGLQCFELFSSNLCQFDCPMLESKEYCQPCVGRKALIRINEGEELPILFSSRAIVDDSGKFLPHYLEKGILARDPFESIDQNGVGFLMDYALKQGRSTRPELKVGICGEHGGDPRSVEFCHRVGMDYVSCSPFRVPIARLAAAQAVLKEKS